MKTKKTRDNERHPVDRTSQNVEEGSSPPRPFEPPRLERHKELEKITNGDFDFQVVS